MQLYGGFEDDATPEIETLSEEAGTDSEPGTGDPAIADLPREDTEATEAEAHEVGSSDEAGADDGTGAGTADDEASDTGSSGTGTTAAGTPGKVDFQADYEAWIRPGIPNIDQLVDEVVASGKSPAAAADAEETAPASELKLSAVEQSLAEEGVGISPIRFAPEPRHWWVVGAAAVLVLALTAQIFYLQLPQWSRDPGMLWILRRRLVVCSAACCPRSGR